MSSYTRDQRRRERQALYEAEQTAEEQARADQERTWGMYPLEYLIEHDLDAEPLLKHILLRLAKGERVEDN